MLTFLMIFAAAMSYFAIGAMVAVLAGAGARKSGLPMHDYGCLRDQAQWVTLSFWFWPVVGPLAIAAYIHAAPIRKSIAQRNELEKYKEAQRVVDQWAGKHEIS